METSVINTTAPAISADATHPATQTPEPQPAAHADKSARFINRAENQTSKVIAEIEKLHKLSNK